MLEIFHRLPSLISIKIDSATAVTRENEKLLSKVREFKLNVCMRRNEYIGNVYVLICFYVLYNMCVFVVNSICVNNYRIQNVEDSVLSVRNKVVGKTERATKLGAVQSITFSFTLTPNSIKMAFDGVFLTMKGSGTKSSVSSL